MICAQKKKELRNFNDKYLTPTSLTQQLLDNINLDKSFKILEPCSSIELSIVNVLKKNGYDVSYNIYNNTPETDFLNFDENNKFDVIFTNTPYGFKNILKFVNKMKKISSNYIICLYPLSILHGTNNYNNLWNDKDFALKEVHLFTRPPWLTDFIREDGKYATGLNHYAWFIWKKGYNGKPKIFLIENSNYVISRKKYFLP